MKGAYLTAQKMKFSIRDFSSMCDQIHSFLRIWSHLLKKSLMENFIFFMQYLAKSVQSNIYVFIFRHSHRKLLYMTLVTVLEKIIIRCYFSAIIFQSFLHSVFACFLYLLTTEKPQMHLPLPNIHPSL